MIRHLERSMKRLLLSQLTDTCSKDWKKITLRAKSKQLILKYQQKANYKFLILRLAKIERQKKNVYSQKPFLITWWKISNLNRKIDRNVSLSFKNALRIKKSLFNVELNVNVETLKSPKQQLMKIKILQNSKCVKISTFRNSGIPSWEKRWKTKWRVPPKLTKLSRLLRLQHRYLMFRTWFANSSLVNKLTVNFLKQSTSLKLKLMF